MSPARIYSYIRFSTSEQRMGDSERRQEDQVRAWARRHGHVLDEELADRGLSGYRGTHRRKGALGRFLKLVKTSDVPEGSVLVVAKVSRLSREGSMPTLKKVVFELLENGITLQLLDPELTFTNDSISRGGLLHVLIALLDSAYQESKDKSDYARSSWVAKRRAAQAGGDGLLSGRHPAWLTVKDGRFEVIAEAAASINLVFKWKLDGLGVGRITKRLNAEAPWSPPVNEKRKGHGWNETYTRAILVNEQVIGVCQPHEFREAPVDPAKPRGDKRRRRVPVGEPIPDYFPGVVDPQVFHAVQRLLETNPDKGGRREKATNLFVDLVRCAYCNAPMVLEVKGKPPRKAYLVCDNGRQAKRDKDGNPLCCYRSIRYDEFEETFLGNCDRLRPESVLPGADDQAALVLSLRQRITARENELAEIRGRVENFLDQIGRTADPRIRELYEGRVRELTDRQAAVEKEKQEDERRLADAGKGAESFTAWQRDLAALRSALHDDDNVDLRLKLRAHLKEFVKRIEVYTHGFEKMYDPDAEAEVIRRAHAEGRELDRWCDPELIAAEDGESFGHELWGDIAEHDPERLADPASRKELVAFIAWAEARMMGKEGRFIRVWWKPAGVTNLVPEGSLAGGMRLIEGSMVSVWPDVEQLWREFQRQQGGVRKVVKPLGTACRSTPRG
jgi:DNA invertase Pin-like site-specific DNA recombinase